ncbi:NlpC/P60 family protein [Sulfurimonas sp. CS5]|jgi:lipoprotein Spr/probable lipoprotein NlpC|uniref:NlpC/P60 family protein n=1 Tax=Sulfurimonas sp. CS5 TaxID=3391145 RepID=UPI0039E78C94
MLRLAIVASLLLLLSGCSTKQTKPYSKASTKKEKPSYKPKQQNWITTSLYEEYKEWHKTPHKLGGISKKGVDCSSLIQRVYRDAFNISLPRTTKNQAKKGYQVNKNSSREGDLVFFKTGYNTRHVGIIIEKDKFMHTSKKYGVMVSSLNNPYWKSKYWQSRRVLP